MRSDYHAGTTWASKSHAPIVKATGKLFSMNMLSAVNSLGHFRITIVEGGVNGAEFRGFLKRLITGVDRKIFLIVDGCPAHEAKPVKQFIARHKDRIELFFLPSYSPQLNPDEITWAHVKRKVASATVQSKDEMKAKIIAALRQLQHWSWRTPSTRRRVGMRWGEVLLT